MTDPGRLRAVLTRVVGVTCLGIILAGMVAAQEREALPTHTDHQPSGNRVAVGSGPISAWSDVELDGAPAWVLPSPQRPGVDWLVALEDGELFLVSADASEHSARSLGRITPGAAPVVTLGPDGSVSVTEATEAPGLDEDPDIPHARVATAADGTTVVLTGPTDRYAHGVLGDALEASRLRVTYADGASTDIEVASSEVIEGIAPILADLDGDGAEEVLVTVSDEVSGARLRIYALDGAFVAESEPIGRGFRWRHQIAVGAIGPDGEIEVVAVRTPHIGGIVEAFRLEGDRLEIVATQPGFSSHRIGSANLDMALMADVDGDMRLDVVVPTDDMTWLGALSRVEDGFVAVASLPLDATLATNVAATQDGEGRLALAVGTTDGRLRVFR